MSDYSEYRKRLKKLARARTAVITVGDEKMFKTGHMLKLGVGNEKYVILSKNGNELTIALLR